MWQWHKSTVILKETVNPTTLLVKLKIETDEPFKFIPGQFITLNLPISEKRNLRLRSYSIANAPNSDQIIELYISYYPEGNASEYFFNELKLNDEITFRGPNGVFVLPQDIQQEICFITTGTGVAPIRSIIQHLQQTQWPQVPITLIFGTRTKSQLLFYNEFKAIEKLQYYPVLSREHWDGCEGYVHPVYQTLFEHKKKVTFYICGWKSMVDEAKQNLEKMGIQKTNIIEELYG